ncbi:non-ribosomal peptide synthetase [Kitasatospora aureofaciens]|uniref:non-ribosomal peptide synthetase n=1 Tax=Kitasatospora aureofaciens TaxID=1894 RepID=UPI0033D5C820
MHSHAKGPSGPRTLTDLFAESVARYPDHAAASDGQQSLTYSDLDQRSSDLARQLRERGVGVEDRVGIYLDRSVDVFVAILGTLKAGAAYVAVDMRYPDARRDLMLTTSGVKLVLTRAESQISLECLDIETFAFRSAPLACPVPAPMDGPEPENAATVLFTSGSSGAPKALLLEHQNVVSFACNPSLPALHPGDRTGQISSLSFDAFHFEMWTTLLSGAEVVVLPPVPELLAQDFQRALRRLQISSMLVPTMVVNHVVREDREAFAPLRILMVGGDVLLPSACHEVLTGQFHGELYNLYGPAESTTACTLQRVTESEAALDSIPIGRPLEGVTVYLVKPDMERAATGETGEIYVGGPGVARGYIGMDDITSKCFITNPFASTPARLYRTGDLARDRGDGTLEFVGRADRQAKIRGYRVEPGEVELALRRHSHVHEVAVLSAGEGNDLRLVAFVALEDSASIKELREYAQAQLPDFMVPSDFIVLDEMPATEHGKRDMTVLLGLLASYEQRQKNYVAPESETECYLADLWGELLQAEKLGTGDDFFALGGHSLLAFRVRARIKRDLGISVDYQTIAGHPVLLDLANAIDAIRKTQ